MDKKQEALIKAKRYIRRPAKLYKRYKTKVKEILNQTRENYFSSKRFL